MRAARLCLVFTGEMQFLLPFNFHCVNFVDQLYKGIEIYSWESCYYLIDTSLVAWWSKHLPVKQEGANQVPALAWNFIIRKFDHISWIWVVESLQALM